MSRLFKELWKDMRGKFKTILKSIDGLFITTKVY